MPPQDSIYLYLTLGSDVRTYDVIKTRMFIRRFLVLKIKTNTGQTSGITDKIESRKNMAKCEGRDFSTIGLLKTFYCCIERQWCRMNPAHFVTKIYRSRKSQ